MNCIQQEPRLLVATQAQYNNHVFPAENINFKAITQGCNNHFSNISSCPWTFVAYLPFPNLRHGVV